MILRNLVVNIDKHIDNMHSIFICKFLFVLVFIGQWNMAVGLIEEIDDK